MHNYLGREGTPPGELLSIGRAEVAGYDGELVAGEAVAARQAPFSPAAQRELCDTVQGDQRHGI